MKKTITVFSLLIIAFIILFQVSKYAIYYGKTSVELVAIIIASIFLIVGIYLNKNSLHKNKKTAIKIDTQKINKLTISNREYEVLQEIALGLSNKEIADKLFVSESTIKTHVSNLLVKLNAKRRTQAVQIAKENHII